MKKLVILSLLLSCLKLNSTAQVTVQIKSAPNLPATISGRLLLFTQPDTTKSIPTYPDPKLPMFAFELKDASFPIDLNLDKAVAKAPTYLSQLKAGYYKFAVMIDRNPEERGQYNPNNLYSTKEGLLEITEDGKGTGTVLINSQISNITFKASSNIKEEVFRSELLSSFKKKDIFLKAAVRFPASYDSLKNDLYPVVFVIPGWGGTHYDMRGAQPANRYGMDLGKEKIYVYLNPETQSPFGLHCFVDSRVNGPWGKALVTEFIPHLVQKYRINSNPNQHFVMGQSSGGYGSLWLQLNYPSSFGGCWAVSPDPVDFSSFIGIDLYEKNGNIFTTASGKARPFFMMNGQPLYTMQESIDAETVVGDGEQIQAFEAEFGIPKKDGRPTELFNRKTGAIDPSVVKNWEPYDLGRYIQKNWKKLAGNLKDKVHVYVGANDNFFLNDAVMALATKARSVNAEIVAEAIPNADHWSIWSPAFTKRVQAEIDARLK